MPSAVSPTLRMVTLLPTTRLSVRLSIVGWMIVWVREMSAWQDALEVHDIARATLVAPVGAAPHFGAEAKAANFMFM